jgi:hypothetical protein
MPSFRVLSGTWYEIEAPSQEVAELAYDAYWDVNAQLPEGCVVVEDEVDSVWA